MSEVFMKKIIIGLVALSSISAFASDCTILVRPNLLSSTELQILVSKGFNPVEVDNLTSEDVGKLAVNKINKQTMSDSKFIELIEDNFRRKENGEAPKPIKDPYITMNQVIKIADAQVFKMEGKKDLPVLAYVAVTPKKLEKLGTCEIVSKKLDRRIKNAFSGPLYPLFRDKMKGGMLHQ
jgi:hypothetical protein